jgi:hypothetical protein
MVKVDYFSFLLAVAGFSFVQLESILVLFVQHLHLIQLLLQLANHVLPGIIDISYFSRNFSF